MHPISKLKFPEIRTNLFRFVSSLADLEYQKTKWGKFDPSAGSYDDFDMAVSFIYDDACLNDDPAQSIGTILIDDHEVVALTRLIAAIDNLLGKYGNDLSDDQYIKKFEWKAILDCAKEVMKLIAREF